jgi:hypothetical protein
VQFDLPLHSFSIVTAPGPAMPAVLDLTGAGASTGGTEADPPGPTTPEGSELGDAFRQVGVSAYYPIHR